MLPPGVDAVSVRDEKWPSGPLGRRDLLRSPLRGERECQSHDDDTRLEGKKTPALVKRAGVVVPYDQSARYLITRATFPVS